MTQRHLSDLRGATRLAADATLGLADLVEAMHERIATLPGTALDGRMTGILGITGLVYKSIRGVTRIVGGSLDGLLKAVGVLTPMLQATGEPVSREREAVLAALNGVLGDHLEASANPLATPMSLRHAGRALVLDAASLQAALPGATDRLVLLVHGLCMNDLQWQRQGPENHHDHGAMLARERGFTPVYLRYNSGRAVHINGAELAGLATVRSAGIMDLRHGNLLPARHAANGRLLPPASVPLPAHINSYAIAAQMGDTAGALKGRVLGDGRVPVASALGHHTRPARTLAFAPERQAVLQGMNHMALLHRSEVAAQLLRWLPVKDPAR